MTAISCGSTSMRPSSVSILSAPNSRHDQQFAVGAVEEIARPSTGWRRKDRCRSPSEIPAEPLPATGERPSTKSVGSVGRGRGSQRSWVRRRGGDCALGPANGSLLAGAEGPAGNRGPDPVEPRTPIRVPRRRECRSRELFSVQTVRAVLRRIAIERQCAWRAPRSRTRCRSRTGRRPVRAGSSVDPRALALEFGLHAADVEMLERLSEPEATRRRQHLRPGR